MYRSILQTCSAMLNGYGTTIEQDKAKLEDDNLSPTMQDAIRTIIKDKRILQETQAWARNQWTQLLDAEPIEST